MEGGLIKRLGLAILFSTIATSSGADTFKKKPYVQNEGVLNTVYMMLEDEKLSKCVEVKPKNKSPYELCSIALRRDSGSTYSRFFIANPRNYKLDLAGINSGNFSIREVRTLDIAFEYSTEPCIPQFHYVPDENGNFDDSELPYKLGPFLVIKNGKLDRDKSKKCKDTLMIKHPNIKLKVLDLEKIRRIHEKVIRDIALTIKDQ